MRMLDGQSLHFVVLGLVVGALSGMLGIGGAVLLVPTLVFLFGFSQGRAQGTSIAALVPPIGIFAAIQYYRHGMLDVRVAALIALGFVLGAFAGASIVPWVPQVWLKRMFATFLAYVAAQMLFADPARKQGAVLPGVVAMAALWTVYGLRKALGQKPRPPRRPPPRPDTEYFI
jgi:uncharacterized membrane protein YfcA